MDHSEAVAAGMVERYVLGELSSPERDVFEEHYFSCEECLTDLRAAFDLKDAIRSSGGVDRTALASGASQAPVPILVRKKVPGGSNRQWGAWAAVFAVAVAGYQAFFQVPGLQSTIRDLEQPRVFTSSTVLRMGSRAVQPDSSERHAGQPLHFFLEIPWESQFQEYEVRITPPGGAPSVTKFPTDQARDNVMLVLPNPVAGSYHVAVFGSIGRGEPKLLQEGDIQVR